MLDFTKKTLPIAVIGATGYTGQELVRLLLKHPQIEIKALTSESSAGKIYGEVFPAFYGKVNLKLEALEVEKIASQAQAVFLCLPHGKSMEAAEAFYERGLTVLDLSADFRLKDLEVYEKTYGPHLSPQLLEEAAYGLPELHREAIKKSRLIACPGCYPTSSLLGLAPLAKNKNINSIIIDAKSGVSGAGRTLNSANLFCEVNESMKAYKIGQHRHQPEIIQELKLMTEEEPALTFTPHLIPLNRGLLSTIYAKLKHKYNSKKLEALYKDFYSEEPFVRVLPAGQFPSTASTFQTNHCQLGLHVDEAKQQAIIVSAIDNLTKGASGQALQCLNIKMGWEEELGLN